ncbi:hypothetical protein Tco_0454177 [Tanacetum coccineum]
MAQNEHPRLYEISHDQSDPANRLIPDREEILTLEEESRSKLNKDLIVQLILFIVDSGCTKHMTGNVSLLCNFVEKYLGTVRFGNDQFAPILGYGDLVQGNITIKRGNDLLYDNLDPDHYTITLPRNNHINLQSVLQAKASPTQARYGIEDFLISLRLHQHGISDLQKKNCEWFTKSEVCPRINYVPHCEVSKAKAKLIQAKTVP